MGVKERKALEKQIRRNQILDAARSLLFSSGIDSISISKIANQAELGVGTIYFYYKNKEEIFIALQKEGVELLYSMILQIVKKDINHEEKLSRIAFCYYRFSEEQKNYFDIINYFLSSPTIYFEPDLKNKIDMSGHKILRIIRDIVADGVQQNVLNEQDPQKFSIMFWGTLHGLLQFKKLEKTVLENESHEKLFNYSVQKLISSIK
ncbi:MAG: TetR/AcrR family transcriptional regulator [Deltaproteobacteria bacterium]|nr:TetR/AcrR family transcriptional regulator [Deltaproteobacteria bacterium]